MSDPTEKLRQELQAARRAVAELQARLENSEAGYRLTTLELEENRSALLFMLEDLEAGRKRIELAHREWMAALDVVDDPIFLHDKEFRILRCNRAYQQCAGISFNEIIGQLYYEVFPKTGGPLSSCLHALDKEEEDEELAVGEAIYRSRAFFIRDAQGAYLHSVHILEDITERRRIDSLLREDEQNYRTLADSSPALIWTSGADKLCNYFNRPWLEFTGRTFEQELGNGWTEGVHPDDFRHCLEVYVSAFERREPFSMEYRLRRHDGEFCWMRDDGRPRYDSDGNFTGYIGFLMDVTERRRAEQELRLRAQLLDSTNDSVFVHDLDGNFIYLNEAAWKSRGYTRDELMGMNLHVLDVPEREKLIEARSRELMEKGQCTFESAHRRKDGFVMPIEVSARLIESDGRKLIISTARDIAERKRIESDLGMHRTELEMQNEALRHVQIDLEESRDQFVDLYEFSPVGYLTLGREEMIDKINLTGATLLGVERNKLLHHRFAPFVATEDRDRWHRHFLDVLQHDGQQRCELALRCGDGSVLHAQLDCLHMKVDGASSVRVALTDITERKQAESQLIEQLDELRRWHNITSGREGRILVLKHEINELLVQAGHPPRYPSAESQDQTEE